MTVQTDIIIPAFRESNWKDIKAVPTSDELAEALVLLQSLVDSVFGMVIGTKLMHWYVPNPQIKSSKRANYPQWPGDTGVLPPNSVNNPPANVRLLMKNTSAETIYFQYQPQDGALMEYVDAGHTDTVTLDANGQLFGLTGGDDTVVITSDFPASRNDRRRWIYRGDAGSWVELTDLTLAGDLPFPAWFNDYFITELAMRLAPRYGNDPRPITLKRNKDMNVFIRGQYEQMGIEIVGDPRGRPSFQSYEESSYYGEDFSQGSPI